MCDEVGTDGRTDGSSLLFRGNPTYQNRTNNGALAWTPQDLMAGQTAGLMADCPFFVTRSQTEQQLEEQYGTCFLPLSSPCPLKILQIEDSPIYSLIMDFILYRETTRGF